MGQLSTDLPGVEVALLEVDAARPRSRCGTGGQSSGIAWCRMVVEWGAGIGRPTSSASYCGQPAPGDGWSIRITTGGVVNGRKYIAWITKSVAPSFLARWISSGRFEKDWPGP